jgi:hypothetical protein
MQIEFSPGGFDPLLPTMKNLEFCQKKGMMEFPYNLGKSPGSINILGDG